MFACIYIPNASGDGIASLLECASTFSPRVENTGAGTVVFDVDGLERLFGGYSEIAEKIRDEVCARGLAPNVAIASNADAAVCAARGFDGTTVIPRGTEAARLRDLPLSVLAPSPDILETLERWGIRTLGAFAKLPAVQISERLGQEGIKLHKLAQGAGTRLIVPHVESLRFVEVMELDYDIATIEPLTFLLSRMLEHICSRLRSRNLATHEVRLALGNYVRILNLPLPVRNSRLLTKLFILDLEAHPPGAAIKRVEVEAFPVKPRVVQNGLFVPLSPEPEKLELTLARLKAVVGENNVGKAEILDTHRPDAFQIDKFQLSNSPPKLGGVARSAGVVPRAEIHDQAERSRNISALEPPRLRLSKVASRYFLDGAATPPNLGGEPAHPETFEQHALKPLTLRLFRPPLEATVQLRNKIPIWIAFHGTHGAISTASGPWRTSGDWWRPTTWDREEWDIEMAAALYRIYYDVHLDRWYAQGVYD
jgi:protein ImuB